jgi:hypothetical protein
MRPYLKVPVHDRRRRPRIVTLRNFGILALGIVALFFVANIVSELRRPTHGEYGRLFSKEVRHANEEVAPATAPIVEAAPIPDQTSPDPMLIAGTAQEEYLGVREPSASTMPVQVPEPEAFFRPAPVLGTSKGKVAIVGDDNGVAIVQSSVAQPQKLSGGFMREQ